MCGRTKHSCDAFITVKKLAVNPKVSFETIKHFLLEASSETKTIDTRSFEREIESEKTRAFDRILLDHGSPFIGAALGRSPVPGGDGLSAHSAQYASRQTRQCNKWERKCGSANGFPRNYESGGDNPALGQTEP